MDEAELIIVVDCLTVQARELAEYLMEAGFQVTRTSDVIAALAAVRALCPGLVLIHPSVPGLDDPAVRAAVQRLAAGRRPYLSWLAPAPSWAAHPVVADPPMHLLGAIRRGLFAPPHQPQITALAS